MVLENPFDSKRDKLNHDIFERFFGHIDILKKRKEFVESIKNEVIKEASKNIQELNPDLMINYNIIYQEISMLMKDFEKTVHTVEKKVKKLFESSTLAEDVYKMRDDMIKIKKKLDKINNGFKGFSKMSAILEEEPLD